MKLLCLWLKIHQIIKTKLQSKQRKDSKMPSLVQMSWSMIWQFKVHITEKGQNFLTNYLTKVQVFSSLSLCNKFSIKTEHISKENRGFWIQTLTTLWAVSYSNLEINIDQKFT
jgi:hypothetical protein